MLLQSSVLFFYLTSSAILASWPTHSYWLAHLRFMRGFFQHDNNSNEDDSPFKWFTFKSTIPYWTRVFSWSQVSFTVLRLISKLLPPGFVSMIHIVLTKTLFLHRTITESNQSLSILHLFRCSMPFKQFDYFSVQNFGCCYFVVVSVRK